MQDPDHQKFLIDPSLRPAHPGLEVARPFDEDDMSYPEVYRQQSLRSAESQQQLRSAVSQPDSSIPERAGSFRSDPRSALMPTYSTAYSPTSTSRTPVQIERFKIEEPPPPLPPLPVSPERHILGVRVLIFWLLIILLVFLLSVGLAIGVALGLKKRYVITSYIQPLGRLSSLNSPLNPTNTPRSATSTTSTPTTTSNQQGVASPAPTNPFCPGQNGATITPYDASGTSIRFSNEVAQSFEIQCNTQYPAGAGSGNPGVRDLMLMTAPDLISCVALCAQYNAGYSNAVGDDVNVGGGICVAVSLIKAPAEFCYLKNATGVNDTSANVASGIGVDSAVLIGDFAAMSEAQLWATFGGNDRTFGLGSNGTNGTVSE
jgi:hypothetical protein